MWNFLKDDGLYLGRENEERCYRDSIEARYGIGLVLFHLSNLFCIFFNCGRWSCEDRNRLKQWREGVRMIYRCFEWVCFVWKREIENETEESRSAFLGWLIVCGRTRRFWVKCGLGFGVFEFNEINDSGEFLCKYDGKSYSAKRVFHLTYGNWVFPNDCILSFSKEPSF